MNSKLSQKLYMMAVVAVMSAFSIVLMEVLSFSVPFVPSFLKIDFSTLPGLLASFSISPIAGAAVALITNLVNVIFTKTAGVGELSNFLLSASFVFSAGLVYRFCKTRKGALLGSLIGVFFAAAVSFPVNYFITYPFYFEVMGKETIFEMYQVLFPSLDTLPKMLLLVNVPFTAAKYLIVAVIAFFIYKPLSPILKGKHLKKS